MTSSDWNEVKLLAADFQRIQLTSSSQRLGERNCIEIVSKLISSKQLDVVFTTDGKEYVTPTHLTKELQDETYVQGGRINILDAARALKVDPDVATNLCEKLVQKEPNDYFVIHGQLIGSNYLNEIAEDIIDKLEQNGHINSLKISQQYDLPIDLIDMILDKHTKKLSFNLHRNKSNPYLYYTDLYFNSVKRMVKGAVLAITRPILCTAIINQCSIDEKEFFSVLESLLASKQVPGTLTDRIGNTCTYIPNIHVKTLNDWVMNFYSNNNYLDYAAMNSVGITDPSSYISRMSIGKDMIALTSCSVGPKIIDDVSNAIEDSIAASSWVDIMDVVPIVFDTKDGISILEYLMKKKKLSISYQIFDETVLVTDKFIEKQTNSIIKTLEGKIKQIVESGDYANALLEWKVRQKITEDKNPELSRKEERKKKSGGKHGGGTQGRETKIKAVKKKYGQKSRHQNLDSDDDDDDKAVINEQFIIEIVSLDEIREYLVTEETFKDIEGEKDSLIDKISLHLYPILNKETLKQAQNMYDQIMANRTGDRRRVHQEFKDKILMLITDFHHYIKGVQKLDNSDVQAQLTTFILKSVGGDIVEIVKKYIKENRENNSELKSNQFDDNQIQNAVEKLQKSLVSKSTDEFNEAIDYLLSAVDIIQKKIDRKKEKEHLQNNRQLLLESLSNTEDAAQVLLISTQLLFQSLTLTMIKISGKFVSSILTYLQKHLNENDFNLLQEYHDLVVLSLKTENHDDGENIEFKLKELTSTIKDFVINFKKSKSEH